MPQNLQDAPEWMQPELETALATYDVSEAAIAKLRVEYLPLTIFGPDDAAGFKVADEARRHVKRIRLAVENKRKELGRPALTWQRTVNDHASALTTGLAPIEAHLKVQTDEYSAARKRVDEEAAAERRRMIQERMDSLHACGVYDRDPLTIAALDEEEFTVVLTSLQQAHADRLAAEAAAQAKVEAEREEMRLEHERLVEERRCLDAEKAEAARKRIDEEVKTAAENAPPPPAPPPIRLDKEGSLTYSTEEPQPAPPTPTVPMDIVEGLVAWWGAIPSDSVLPFHETISMLARQAREVKP